MKQPEIFSSQTTVLIGMGEGAFTSRKSKHHVLVTIGLCSCVGVLIADENQTFLANVHVGTDLNSLPAALNKMLDPNNAQVLLFGGFPVLWANPLLSQVSDILKASGFRPSRPSKDKSYYVVDEFRMDCVAFDASSGRLIYPVKTENLEPSLLKAFKERYEKPKAFVDCPLQIIHPQGWCYKKTEKSAFYFPLHYSARKGYKQEELPKKPCIPLAKTPKAIRPKLKKHFASLQTAELTSSSPALAIE